MSSPLLQALLVLLAIEAAQAWKIRSQYCTICGRKMGLRHVERCHKKFHYSPGVSIVIILTAMVAIVAVLTWVSR